MNYLIVGAGSHGKVVYSILLRKNVPSEKIFFIDIFEKKEDKFLDRPIIGGLTSGIENLPCPFHVIVSYGGTPYTGNLEREKASIKVEDIFKDNHNYEFATIIDPSAIISEDVSIDTNVSIGFFSAANIHSIINKGVIINNKVLIEHDVVIGDYSNISPGAMLLGSVKIGKRVFVGSGAIIRNNISIGDNSVIGMGTVVINDVPPDSLVLGNPGIVVRNLKE